MSTTYLPYHDARRTPIPLGATPRRLRTPPRPGNAAALIAQMLGDLQDVTEAEGARPSTLTQAAALCGFCPITWAAWSAAASSPTTVGCMRRASAPATSLAVRDARRAYATSTARSMIQLPTLVPSEAITGQEATMSTSKTAWHQVRGKWTRSLGERGVIRLFQKRRGGMFYREVWVAGTGKTLASLGTRIAARRSCWDARSWRAAPSGALRAPYAPHTRRPLETVPDRVRIVPRNKSNTRRDNAIHAQILIAVLGEACDVRSLTARDQAAYTKRRLAGGSAAERRRDHAGSDRQCVGRPGMSTRC